MDNQPSSLAPTFLADVYQRQIDSISETTKWLIGAFAAVGAAIIGSLKFTGIGELSGLDFIIAVSLAFLSVAAVAVAIFSCARVIAAVRPGLDDIIKDDWLRCKVQDGPVLLLSDYPNKEGRRCVAWLKKCYEEKVETLRSLEDVWSTHRQKLVDMLQQNKPLSLPSELSAMTGPFSRHVVESARKELDVCRLAEHEVLTFANFIQVQRRFERAQQVLGVCVFAVLGFCVWFSVLTSG